MQIVKWRQTGHDADAALIARIAAQPTAIWLTGGEDPGGRAAAIVDAAQDQHAVAQLVIYEVPGRDCGQYSSGGAADATAYLVWVRSVARGLGDHDVIVILEPDSIDQAASGCLGSAGASRRYALLASAAGMLRADPNAHVYLDAGDAGWLAPGQIVGPLKAAGVEDDAGFSLNVANFYTTTQSIRYGLRLSALLGHKHFVVDTSRDGNGPPSDASGVNEWCNPSGRALGDDPTTDTGNPLVDAFLWVKYPGQSDGACGPGEPPAGVWWPAYALQLVRDTRR